MRYIETQITQTEKEKLLNLNSHPPQTTPVGITASYGKGKFLSAATRMQGEYSLLLKNSTRFSLVSIRATLGASLK